MAKLSAWVVAVAASFSLQGAASAPGISECMDLTGTWWSSMGDFEPFEVVQNQCSFTVTVPSRGMVYNGTVDGRNATLEIPGTEIGSHVSTSVDADGQEIWWSWGDVWHRDCPGGFSGEYQVEGRDTHMGIYQHGCTLWLDRHDGSHKRTAEIREGLGLFANDTRVGELASRDLLTWDGLQLKRLRATPCLDFNMFEDDALMYGHCTGDETDDPSKKEWCLDMGCHWEGDHHEEDLCHCDTQDLCEHNGFTWELATCSLWPSWYNSYFGVTFESVNTWTERPEVGGWVSGEYDRCLADEEFHWHMTEMSHACCQDRMSICDVRGQPKATPCFDPADFNPEATMDEHCAGDETGDPARKEWCVDMGCYWDENEESDDRCHCHTKELCEGNGFTWERRTCATGASWLPPLPGLYVYQTTEHGTTTGAMDKCQHDEDFSGMVQWMREPCCNQKPSICDEQRAPGKCISLSRDTHQKIMDKGYDVARCAQPPPHGP